MLRKYSIFKKKGSDDRRASQASQGAEGTGDGASGPSWNTTTFAGTNAAPILSRYDTEISISPGTLLSPQELQEVVQTRRSSDVEAVNGKLGLTVVHNPENGKRKADIVFVHGLGGASKKTWSKYTRPELFWPLTFLPLEPDICLARILTFGYNADFRKAGGIHTSVLDFAKDLLYELRYSRNDQGEELGMGQVPLIFVVHSMGGLLVKEAYIQGQHDPQYEEIVKAISAIAFLATPHRGTNLAQTLNRILQSTLVSSSKQYIAELTKNSFTLQKLNEQFRHIAPRLDIISFYETQPTSVGHKKARIMILEKDSSVLGYPGETSKALDADHHGVCKYESPSDPNYITVKNVLKSLVGKIIACESLQSLKEEQTVSRRKQSYDLRAILAITELPSADYAFFRDQWVEGTCEWILSDETYLRWIRCTESTPRLLWLYGGPASGKSVLSSFIINSLVSKEVGAHCQYFFIRFGDRSKCALSSIFRSLAYQMALVVPGFQEKVLELADEAIDFGNADPRVVWDCLKSVLSSTEFQQPLIWIIDGIDETENPRLVLKYLADLVTIGLQIRVLLVSRRTNELEAAFQKIPDALHPTSINIDGHEEDLRQYLVRELDMPGKSEFVTDLIERVTKGAQNNFLWVRLAVEKLNMCYTRSDVERTLQDLPVGMEALYDRMATSIIARTATERNFVVAVLRFVTCSLGVLTVLELSQAIDNNEFLDFQRMIVDLCSGFVVIDNSGNVSMIHQTAREYLLDERSGRTFYISRDLAHKELFLSCMRCLATTGLRGKISQNRAPEFVLYAASSWSSHLVEAPVGCKDTEMALTTFLTGPSVLIWIHFLSSTRTLNVLVRASKHLTRYIAKRNQGDKIQQDHGHVKQQELYKSWAIDFVKLAGKFGRNLKRSPESIYKIIPSFCPQNSAIYQQFGKGEARNLSISGFSTDYWDDSLGRFSFTSRTYASFIQAAGAHIFILLSSGVIFVYDVSTFEQQLNSPIQHGERVYRMLVNSKGTILISYGYRTTKIWEVATGKCTLAIANLEIGLRPLFLSLKGRVLLVGTDDKCVRALDLDQSSPTWNLVADLEETELEGHYLNAASHMAINTGGNLITVAYRGHPLSAWEIDGPVHIRHLWMKEANYRGEVVEAIWHPHMPQVFGIYTTGQIFKWSPYDDTVEEKSIGANRLTMSRDGNLLATGDVKGIVRVYITTSLSCIYFVAAQDTVLGLAFSPDLRRLYDLRGFYGNAWEPNALLKYAEMTDSSYDASGDVESMSQSSDMTENAPKWVDPVTTIATSPLGRFYCCGTIKGVITLHDQVRGVAKVIYHSQGLLSIYQMTWSLDGRFLCFSDSGKRVCVVSLDIDTSKDDSVTVLTSSVTIPDAPILQLLFRHDSSTILVHTESRIHTISVKDCSVTKSTSLDTPRCRWIIHPQDIDLLIGFGPSSAHVFDWTLAARQDYTFSYAKTLEDTVDRVLVTQDKKRILLQLSVSGLVTKDRTFVLLGSDKLTTTSKDLQQQEPTISISLTILPNLSSEIALAITFLPRNRLIFLSKTFDVCCWQIPTVNHGGSEQALSFLNPKMPISIPIRGSAGSGTDSSIQQTAIGQTSRLGTELFSLPGDWISRECWILCSVWTQEKSLLCPRNGEVAVVRSSALV